MNCKPCNYDILNPYDEDNSPFPYYHSNNIVVEEPNVTGDDKRYSYYYENRVITDDRMIRYYEYNHYGKNSRVIYEIKNEAKSLIIDDILAFIEKDIHYMILHINDYFYEYPNNGNYGRNYHYSKEEFIIVFKDIEEHTKNHEEICKLYKKLTTLNNKLLRNVYYEMHDFDYNNTNDIEMFEIIVKMKEYTITFYCHYRFNK